MKLLVTGTRVRYDGPMKLGNGARLRVFLESVIKETDECVAPLRPDPNGYVEVKYRGKRNRAHVVACEMEHGLRPLWAQEVRHLCNNRACFNRRHVTWSTVRDNQADRREAGTHQYGPSVNGSKLTESQVLEIYDRATASAGRWRGSETYADIAAEFGICPDNVKQIKARKRWAYLLNRERGSL